MTKKLIIELSPFIFRLLFVLTAIGLTYLTMYCFGADLEHRGIDLGSLVVVSTISAIVLYIFSLTKSSDEIKEVTKKFCDLTKECDKLEDK